MEFTRSQFEAFKEDVKKALKEVSEKYDVDISTGKITYSDMSFDLKLSVSKSGFNQEESDFKRYCELYGLKKSDYGKKVRLDGKVYKLVGLSITSNKYPIILEQSSGKRIKCTASYLKTGELF